MPGKVRPLASANSNANDRQQMVRIECESFRRMLPAEGMVMLDFYARSIGFILYKQSWEIQVSLSLAIVISFIQFFFSSVYPAFLN